MKRIPKLLGASLALAVLVGTAPDAGSTDQYADYYAAKEAQERGDCAAFVQHLNAYLQNHPYLQQKYPDHYWDMKLRIAQCEAEGEGKVIVRGVGDESSAIDPLSDDPPVAD